MGYMKSGYNKGTFMKKKTNLRPLALLLSALMAAVPLSSCSSAGGNGDTEPNAPAEIGAAEPHAAETAPPETEAPETEVRDDLGEYDFGGADFGAMTFENQNFHYRVRADEMTGTLSAVTKRLLDHQVVASGQRIRIRSTDVSPASTVTRGVEEKSA